MIIFLRDPVENDYAAIASWVPDAAACARWAGPHVPYPFTVKKLRDLLRMPQGRSRVLGQVDVRQPLGFGQYWVRCQGEVHLGRIIVSPGQRGRGLGKQMCRLLMQEAVAQSGADAVTLRVYRDNPAARSVYAALGFRSVETASDTDVLFMRAPARTLRR